MGGQPCPNCRQGILVRTGKGRKRCKQCGYLKHDSSNRKSQGTILGFDQSPKEEESKEEEEIPRVVEGRYIPRGEGYHTENYQIKKFMRDRQLQMSNKLDSVKKILADLRKNKYSGIKVIQIEGEMWDVASGELIRAKEKPEEEREIFSPEEIIEELVTKDKIKEEKKKEK